ncbi:MAG: hypothetical protein RLZZ524_933 [Pseudomonadota bacterium]
MNRELAALRSEIDTLRRQITAMQRQTSGDDGEVSVLDKPAGAPAVPFAIRRDGTLAKAYVQCAARYGSSVTAPTAPAAAWDDGDWGVAIRDLGARVVVRWGGYEPGAVNGAVTGDQWPLGVLDAGTAGTLTASPTMQLDGGISDTAYASALVSPYPLVTWLAGGGCLVRSHAHQTHSPDNTLLRLADVAGIDASSYVNAQTHEGKIPVLRAINRGWLYGNYAFQFEIPTVTWANVIGPPATYAPSAHNQAWSTITSTPTTLSGYGITDAVAWPGILSNAIVVSNGTGIAGVLNAGSIGFLTQASGGLPAWGAADGTTVEFSGTTLRVKDAGISSAKLRNSAATSVIGRSAGTTGVPADIAATADGQYLRRIAGALAWSSGITVLSTSTHTAGTTTTAPAGATMALMMVVGGGGGALTNSTSSGGVTYYGGGGSSGLALTVCAAVTGGGSYTVSIGAAGSNSATPTAGGNTTISGAAFGAGSWTAPGGRVGTYSWGAGGSAAIPIAPTTDGIIAATAAPGASGGMHFDIDYLDWSSATRNLTADYYPGLNPDGTTPGPRYGLGGNPGSASPYIAPASATAGAVIIVWIG